MTQRGIGDVILRRYKETDTQFATREFNYCMWQIGRCHDLQAERVRMGWEKPAIHYQTQAAIWYERAVECRARHAKTLADLIPGTQVRWNEVFFIWTWPDLSRSVSRPLSWNEIYDIVDPFSKLTDLRPHIIEITPKRGPRHPIYWLDESRFIGDGVDEFAAALKLKPVIIVDYADGVFERARDHGMTRQWKTVPDPRPRETHYTSPKKKYDNPRDVPLTLAEIAKQLKRWSE